MNHIEKAKDMLKEEIERADEPERDAMENILAELEAAESKDFPYEQQACAKMPKFCMRNSCRNRPMEEIELIRSKSGFTVCPSCGCSYGKIAESKPEPDLDKCQYCGAGRVVRTSGEWQFYCECDNPEKRPTKPEPMNRRELDSSPRGVLKQSVSPGFRRKPEPGEFTKNVRDQITLSEEPEREFDAVVARKCIRHACDIIDSQAEQIKKQKKYAKCSNGHITCYGSQRPKTCFVGGCDEPIRDVEISVEYTLLQEQIREIKAKDNEIKGLKKQPRCPCGGRLEGLGYLRHGVEHKVEFRCTKCQTQMSVEYDVWEKP